MVALGCAPASGWCCFARRRYARAISSRDAVARDAEDGVRVELGHGRRAVYADALAILSRRDTKRTKRPPTPARPAHRPWSLRRPTAAAAATVPPATEAPIDGEQLDAAILRFLRRYPNKTVDLAPLAAELGVDPYRIQLAVESLGRRGMVVVPFIEPGTAGGATLTASVSAG